MCGICGIININNEPVSIEEIRLIRDKMIHRGPDDFGEVIIDNVGFGHRRLSIIDLSPAGKQPMSNEDQTIWLTYNGELYNFVELRIELESKYHKFKSNTDSEVIIHAYEEWGTDCLKKFRGMFAFAIYDLNKKLLFCARDRFGIKPFFYWFNGRKFIFTSEIKALLSLSEIEAIPNNDIVNNYILYGISDTVPITFFKNIYTINPSHFLILKNREIHINRYWELKQTDEPLKPNESYWELFIDSVKRHLISDVPVGTCLSGGLDSSSIISAIHEIEENRQIKTFSSFFLEGIDFDERNYINEINKNFNTDPYFITPKGEDLPQLLPQIIYYLDEPPSAMGVYPEWHVLKLASQNVTVLLNGQGGDETLAGYEHYYRPFLIDLLKSFNFNKYKTERLEILNRVSPELIKGLWILSILPEKIVKILRYFKHRVLGNTLPGDLETSPVIKKTKRIELPEPKIFKDNLNNSLYWDLTSRILPALLRFEDRLSMAHSLEVRVPFLDHKLVELSFSFSPNWKIKDGWTKYVLRKSPGKLPNSIRWRKDKKGFPVPTGIWFKTILSDWVKEILLSKEAFI